MLFWVPCKFTSGAVKWNCWMTQQSNRHIQGHLHFPNWLFGCSAQGTEPNSARQVWYVGIQEEKVLECFKSYDICK